MKLLIPFLIAIPLAPAAAAERVALATDYPGAAWSPYLVGAGIGVLSWFTFLFADKAIGASSFYATLAGFLGKIIAPRHIAKLHYFRENSPKVGWGFVFVLSTIAGGFLSAWSGNDLHHEWLHSMWIDHFGADSAGMRILTAILGGALMAFGARLAGGCTSGHGISGTLQLNIGSWLTAGCIFIGGIIVAKLFYFLA